VKSLIFLATMVSPQSNYITHTSWTSLLWQSVSPSVSQFIQLASCPVG